MTEARRTQVRREPLRCGRDTDLVAVPAEAREVKAVRICGYSNVSDSEGRASEGRTHKTARK